MLTGEAQEVVDLPAMGADPAVPDVFVEVDHMVADDHSHAPDPGAIADVVAAFARHGVHLHVDYGAQAPLTYGAASTWGALSGGNALDHREHLGDNGLFGWFGYRWGAFDDVKDDNFAEVREPVFHYNVWAHQLSEQLGTTSGMSRGSLQGASDFVVSLGGWTDDVGTVAEQAGTFMHELGHNLGLGHGGDDGVNHKPNYLSVMNYLFQDGLPGGSPTLDYSPSARPDLDENALVEADGIGTGSSIWTHHHGCGKIRGSAGDAIDWNCDGDHDDTLALDVNDDGELTVLRGAKDWGELLYTGGAIGMPGGMVELPAETEPEEPELTREAAEALRVDTGTPEVDAAPTLPTGVVAVGTEVTATLGFTVPDGTADQVTATWSWGDGATSTGVVTAGSGTPTVTGSHTFDRAGIRSVTVTLVGPGGEVTSAPATVVVVDRAAGGVAALGTFTPVAGASTAAPSARGTASVVVAGDWVRGKDRPVAATALSWSAARLTVVGLDGRWLVVDGRTAVLETAAVVNGRTGYLQRVTVVAGSAPTVRVQVWDPRVGGLDDAAARVLDTGAGVRLTGAAVVGG